MESTKRILGYRTLVNLEAMNGVRTIVYGQMDGKMDQEMLSKIEGQGSIHTTSFGSLNNVYLLAHLRRILELDDVIRVAQEVCRIPIPGSSSSAADRSFQRIHRLSRIQGKGNFRPWARLTSR